MKVWELIGKLEKMPAGYEVNIAVFRTKNHSSTWLVSADSYVHQDDSGDPMVVLHADFRDFIGGLEALTDEER